MMSMIDENHDQVGALAAWAAINEQTNGLLSRPGPDEPLPEFQRVPRVPTADEELTAAMLDAAPPGYSRYARWLLPVDLRDQIEAAEAEASALAAGMQNTSVQAPEWLRLHVLDTIAQWVNGTASTCLHGPSPHRPQMVFAAVSRPGRVVCRKCLPLLKTPRAELFKCDSCRRDCEGEVMQEFACRVGIFIVLAGTCIGCAPM